MALAAGAAGCGGDSELSPKALAAAALLKKKDMPKDWTTAPLVKIGGRCGKSPLDSADAVRGSHFSSGTVDVQQQIGVFATKALAQRAYSALGSPEQMRCFKHVAERGMELYAGEAILRRLTDVGSPSADTGEGRLMTATIASPIGPVSVYVERLAADVGRAVIVMKVTSGFQPMPHAFYRQVMSLPFTRVARAEGRE